MKKTVLLIFAAVMLAASLACAEKDAEIENYTRYADYEPQLAEPIGLILGENHQVLIAWFSRAGNTVFESDVDAVTSASLQVDGNGELLGNAQVIAKWIAEESGADVFPIQTMYTYPSDPGQEVESGMQMRINDTQVTVVWEENDSVAALRELAISGLTIQMSMYGGFEQVGSIGQRLPSRDAQTTTTAGDIVLYSSNQMVVFYGSNSWAYTRLGKIIDKTPEEMKALLGNGDVTITLTID